MAREKSLFGLTAGQINELASIDMEVYEAQERVLRQQVEECQFAVDMARKTLVETRKRLEEVELAKLRVQAAKKEITVIKRKRGGKPKNSSLNIKGIIKELLAGGMTPDQINAIIEGLA